MALAGLSLVYLWRLLVSVWCICGACWSQSGVFVALAGLSLVYLWRLLVSVWCICGACWSQSGVFVALAGLSLVYLWHLLVSVWCICATCYCTGWDSVCPRPQSIFSHTCANQFLLTVFGIPFICGDVVFTNKYLRVQMK